MNRWILRRKEEFLELVYTDEFRLYSSMNRVMKGKPTYFSMTRQELIEFRDKINDALELTK
jgi:hypothetical protein